MSKLGRATKNFISTLFGTSGSYLGGGWNTRRQREAQLLAAKGLIFAAIDKKARALVDTELIISVRSSQTESKQADLNHWLVKLLQKPNPIGLTTDEIFLLAEKQMSGTPNGSAYIYTPTPTDALGNPIPNSLPNQMYILPTNTVSIQYHPVFGIAGYNVSINGQQSYIPAEHICHLRDIENASTFQEMLQGKGKILACIQELEIDKEAKDYLTRFFENDARPPLIMELSTGEPEGGWENYKARWNQMLPNYQLKAAIDGMKFVDVPAGALSLNYDSIVKEAKSDFTAIMGVPMPLLRAEFQNRATAVETRATFNEETMNPIRKYISGALTQHFQQFDPEVVFELTPYQYNDAEETRKQELHELGTGRATINSFRAEKGLPPVPNGDVLFITNGREMLPLNIAVNPPAPPTGGIPKSTSAESVGIEKKSLISTKDIEEIAARQLYWRKTFNKAVKFEKEVSKIVAKVIGTDLKAHVLPKFKGKKYKGYTVYSKVGVDDVIFDNDEWTKKLIEAMRKAMYEYALSVGTGTIEGLGEDLPEDFTKVIEAAVEESTGKIVSVTGTLKDTIQEALKNEGIATPEDLAAKIEEIFARYDVEGGNTQNIATTTATATTGAAQDHTAKSIGAKKTWLSQRDGDVRPAHIRADGQVANAQGLFTVGGEKMKYPAGGGIAANNCNCRCYLFVSR